MVAPHLLAVLAACAPPGRDETTAGPARAAVVAAAQAELRPTVEWLLAAMPAGDRATLSADFLLAHAQAAFAAWQAAPWRAQVDEALFRDALLPYASVSETRELWLPKLRELCLPLIAGVTEPGHAAVRLNQQLFAKVNVRYSTERQRADQSPSESMASGLASCSGLAILLIDACRSVGVPARFVGVPRWADGSGNHSWVEVWDGAQWRFTGAAEPAGDALDEGWFTGRAAGQSHEPPEHAIWAVTWNDSPALFPMVFDPTRPRARAIDVTARYLAR
ncbi:MAG: transglutaminase domain-containing protein, partial [Planctomycetes bacterium]|nr:transglutaminase domain-containing protein [Planctomycetota bacterium]